MNFQLMLKSLQKKVLLSAELNTIKSFLESTQITDLKEFITIPKIDKELVKTLGILEKQLKEYEETCKKIDKNNMYIEERNKLIFDLSMKAPKEEQELYTVVEEFKNDVNKLQIHKQNLEKSLKGLDTTDECYACGQKIDNSQTKQLYSDLDKDLCNTVIKVDAVKEELEYAKENIAILSNNI